MIDLDSEKGVVVPREKAIAALESGRYRLREEPDDHRNTAGAVKGFGIGVGRGLTFNLSDIALKKMGVDVENITAANPGMTTTGEVTGIVGSMLIPGMVAAKGAQAGTMLKMAKAAATPVNAVASLGTFTANKVEGAIIRSLVGKAEAGIATRALAKAAGVGAAGALENMAWTAGKVLSEEDLGDPKAVAEALVAAAGPAAIWGGGFGAAMGGASVLFGAGARKMADTAAERLKQASNSAWAQKKVGEFAEEANYKALGLSQAQADKIMQRSPDAFKMLHDPDILPDGPILQPKMTQKDISARIKLAAKNAGAEIGAIYDQVDNIASTSRPSGHLLEAESLIDDINKLEHEYMGKWGDKSRAVETVRSFYKQLEGRELLTAKDAKGLWEQVKMGSQRYAQPGSAEWANRDLWHVLKNATRAEVETLAPELAARLARADSIYSVMGAMRKAVKESASGSGVKDLDTIFRRAGEVAAWRASSSIGSMARGAGVGAAVGGIAGGVPGAMVGAAGSMALQQFKPAASTIAATANKAAHYGLIQNKIMEVQKRIDKAVLHFMEGVGSGKGFRAMNIGLSKHLYNETKETDVRKQAHKLAQRMHHLGSNPQLLMDNMAVASHGLQDDAPMIAQALAQTLAVTFRVTRQHADGVMPALDPLQPNLADDTQLPAEDVAHKFVQVATAALDPVATLERLADGTITGAEVQVIREAYPALYGMISMQIMDHLADMKERVPYEQRIALGIWLGQPTDRTLTPAFLARQLQVLQAPQGGPGKAPGGGAINQPGMNDAARRPSQKGLQQADKIGKSLAPATQAVTRSLAK